MRAVIAEDSVLLREGSRGSLGENGLEVVEAARRPTTCCESAELLARCRVVDIRLPDAQR